MWRSWRWRWARTIELVETRRGREGGATARLHVVDCKALKEEIR
jgi:hypothetical protein